MPQDRPSKHQLQLHIFQERISAADTSITNVYLDSGHGKIKEIKSLTLINSVRDNEFLDFLLETPSLLISMSLLLPTHIVLTRSV
jgi:hypothetical protein